MFWTRPGDIIVMRNRWRPWHLLIPGYWTHASMIVKHGFVVEASGKGVVYRSLSESISNAKDLVVLRATFADRDHADYASVLAMTMIGMPYDFLFSEDNKSVYCSEMIWLVYKRACGDDFKMKRRKRWWRMTVTPSDLANASVYFKRIGVDNG